MGILSQRWRKLWELDIDIRWLAKKVRVCMYNLDVNAGKEQRREAIHDGGRWGFVIAQFIGCLW